MGCYPPLGKMLSKALWICNGKKRYESSSRAMVYSPPRSYSYPRSMAMNVAFSSDNPVIIVPPSEASQVPSISTHQYPSDAISPSPHAEVVQPKEPIHPEPAPEPDQHGPTPHPNWTDRPPPRVRFAGEAHQHGPPPRPNRSGRPHARFADETISPHEAIPHPSRKEPTNVRFAAGGPIPGPSIHEPVTGYHADPGFRYMMSPLPRSEYSDRRREYFSGEYNYYPTPVREGIYKIATDANRLTTIFSEENPNACTVM